MVKLKQQGASTPLALIFLIMAAVILTISFKLYPAFYDHWLITSAVNSFNDEAGLEDMSEKEITRRFNARLSSNSVRDFDTKENVFISKDDGVLIIEVEYEVRVPMYRNIDAIIKFEESLEKTYSQ